MYKIQKKGPAGKNFGVFSPRHSQNCILIENLTHRCIQTGHFFPKSGHFFSIFKIGQGRPPHPPSYSPGCTPDILFFKCLRVLQFIFKKIITWYCFPPDLVISLLILILEFSVQGDAFDGVYFLSWFWQKQPSGQGVLRTRCSEMMKQIYRRTPMSLFASTTKIG